MKQLITPRGTLRFAVFVDDAKPYVTSAMTSVDAVISALDRHNDAGRVEVKPLIGWRRVIDDPRCRTYEGTSSDGRTFQITYSGPTLRERDAQLRRKVDMSYPWPPGSMGVWISTFVGGYPCTR